MHGRARLPALYDFRMRRAPHTDVHPHALNANAARAVVMTSTARYAQCAIASGLRVPQGPSLHAHVPLQPRHPVVFYCLSGKAHSQRHSRQERRIPDRQPGARDLYPTLTENRTCRPCLTQARVPRRNPPPASRKLHITVS